MPQAPVWDGNASVKGSSEAAKMALLTFSLVGLQFTWGIEMTYCTPYLLQLGLTKNRTSMVWIAGPLSGLIMQPIVGVIADNSTSRWGRRRPFMVWGSVVVALCLLVLGWTSEIVGFFTQDQENKSFWTLALAIMSIYAVDFAINAGNVDRPLPASSVTDLACSAIVVQELDRRHLTRLTATARLCMGMVAIGHLVGYGAGTLNLVSLLGTTLGSTQFKQLTVIAAAALLFAIGVTSWAVEERVLVTPKDSYSNTTGPYQTLAKIFRTTLNLPPRIQAICWIQFWAWIAWFPFLFYSPTWVGETYLHSHPPSPNSDPFSQIGRIGSLSLTAFSIVTLLSSLIIPRFIQSPTSPSTPTSSFTPRPPAFLKALTSALAPLASLLPDTKPDLSQAWQASHLLFSITMLLAPLVRVFETATAIVAFSGIPWALASWAPFAFLGVEINRQESESTSSLPLEQPRKNRISSSFSASGSNSPSSRRTASGIGDKDRLVGDDKDGAGETAGIYLGILNLFTTLPQFVGTFISMVVFSIFEPKRIALGEGEGATTAEAAGRGMFAADTAAEVGGNESAYHDAGAGVNPIAVCLFIGGLTSLVAAVATKRFREMK